jgi:hypothetical protein
MNQVEPEKYKDINCCDAVLTFLNIQLANNQLLEICELLQTQSHSK